MIDHPDDFETWIVTEPPSPRATWADYPAANAGQLAAYQRLRAWLDDPERIDRIGAAVLMGPPGVGKTDLLGSLFQHTAYRDEEQEWPSTWIKWPSLVRLCAEATRLRILDPHNGWHATDLVTQFALAGSVFIDDFRAPTNACEKRFLQHVLDIRDEWLGHWQGGWTTNLDCDELLQALGHRHFDRLNDCALWLPMQGRSLRQPAIVPVPEQTPLATRPSPALSRGCAPLSALNNAFAVAIHGPTPLGGAWIATRYRI